MVRRMILEGILRKGGLECKFFFLFLGENDVTREWRKVDGYGIVEVRLIGLG